MAATNAMAATARRRQRRGGLDHQCANHRNNAWNRLKRISQTRDPTAPYKDTNGNWTVNFALGAVHHQHQPDEQHRATMCLTPAPVTTPGC